MEQKLSNNIELWPQEILNYIYSDYQFLAPYAKNVFFKSIDANSGVAMGALHLENPSSGIAGVVPLIINEFSMKPLDVFMIKEDEYIPLTENRIVEYLGMNVGKTKRPKPTPGGEMPVSTNPPGHGQGKGVVKRASLLESVLEKKAINPGLLKIIMDAMPNKDGGVAKRISAVIEKLPKRAIWARYNPRDGWRATVSDDTYRLTNINGFDSISDELKKFDENIPSELKRTGNVFISRENRKPFIMEDMAEPPKKLSGHGLAVVVDDKYKPRVGTYCTDVTDMMGKPVGLSMWFDGDKYAIAEEMTGYFMRESFAGRITKMDEGLWYALSFDEEGIKKCTLPFKLKSKPKISEAVDGVVFDAINYYGKEITIKYSKSVDIPISNYEKVDGDIPGSEDMIIYIPTSWKLHSVGSKRISLTYLTKDNIHEILRGKMNGSVVIRGFNDSGLRHYYMSGDCCEMFNSDGDNNFDPKLGKHVSDDNKLIWYLLNYGFGEGTARSIMNSVWENGRNIVTVGNIAPPKKPSAEFKLPGELIRIASDESLIPDDSVDSVLGLGFLEDVDIYEALEHLDELRALESVLSKILFYTRMGINIASEQDVGRALEYVSNVVDQMEEFKRGAKK